MAQEVVAEISVVPVGTADPSVSGYVAACLEVLKRVQGIRYQLTAMGTIIQGPLERVLDAAYKMHQAPFEMGAKRTVTNLKIDDRRDKPLTMEGKLDSVARKMA